MLRRLLQYSATYGRGFQLVTYPLGTSTHRTLQGFPEPTTMSRDSGAAPLLPSLALAALAAIAIAERQGRNECGRRACEEEEDDDAKAAGRWRRAVGSPNLLSFVGLYFFLLPL